MGEPARVLGRGRSGVVFLRRGRDAAELACKVFDSRSVTRLVQWVLLGAPNPYAWNGDAVRCAVLRRRILAALVPGWLEGRARVARAVGHVWNAEHAAWELRTERSHGRHAHLHHPFRMRGADEVRQLRSEVMRPLQEHLVDAGFDGLAWQAGLGNPVAANNFLREEDGTWTWIDLESGVPAIVPADPRKLLTFYLPRAWHHGRLLFDDVDVPKLVGWLESRRDDLEATLGADVVAGLFEDALDLDACQRRWKGQPRHERSIEHRWRRGEIDDGAADWYRDRPGRWYLRETGLSVAAAGRGLARIPAWLVARVRAIPLRAIAASVGAFFASERFRAAVARQAIESRLQAWEERGQLDGRHARELRRQLDSAEAGSFVTDFGVHVALKPAVKLTQWWLLPTLFAFGIIDEVTLGLSIAFGGAVARTAYTAGRLVQATVHGRERPWVALGVGLLPMVGNSAYPVQLLYSSANRQQDVALFILHDAFATGGVLVPIWGGQDTLTEHALNRLPDRLGRWRRTGPDVSETREGETG